MTVKKSGTSGIARGSHIIHACRASRSICGLATKNLHFEPIRSLLQQVERGTWLSQNRPREHRIAPNTPGLASRIKQHCQTENDSDRDLLSGLGTLVSC